MAMKKKQEYFVWDRLDEKTIEYCRVTYAELISVNSDITGIVDDSPFHVNYNLIINNDWQIYSFSIKAWTGKEINIFLKRINSFDEKSFVWSDEAGNLYPDFNECLDIDISLTPLTNTLPIRRLSPGKNQPAIIDVLYVEMPSGNLKHVKQRYTNLGKNTYLYESLDSDFKSEININENGFVTQYSVYWKLIKHLII